MEESEIRAQAALNEMKATIDAVLQRAVFLAQEVAIKDYQIKELAAEVANLKGVSL